MRIIPQHPENQPPCPQSGMAGGPVHPAHAVEVQIINRVSDAWPYPDEPELDEDGGEIVNPIQDAVYEAASSTRYTGMKLYLTEGSPTRPDAFRYYQAAFFVCLTCGFVLPAQVMSR